MGKPIINLDEVKLVPRPLNFVASGPAAERFDARMGPIAPLLGASQLGYNLTVVPPNKAAFPFHNHRVNEEMVLVLQGTGEVRIGEQRYPLRAGDIVAMPAGGSEMAHQIVNNGNEELRYLAVSTRLSPEVAEYPDSGKFGVLAEFPADGGGKSQRFMFVGRKEDSRDYWEGE